MICNNCKKNNDEDSNYCVFCGGKLEDTFLNDISSDNANNNNYCGNKSSKRKSALIILFIILITLTASIVTYVFIRINASNLRMRDMATGESQPTLVRKYDSDLYRVTVKDGDYDGYCYDIYDRYGRRLAVGDTENLNYEIEYSTDFNGNITSLLLLNNDYSIYKQYEFEYYDNNVMSTKICYEPSNPIFDMDEYFSNNRWTDRYFYDSQGRLIQHISNGTYLEDESYDLSYNETAIYDNEKIKYYNDAADNAMTSFFYEYDDKNRLISVLNFDDYYDSTNIFRKSTFTWDENDFCTQIYYIRSLEKEYISIEQRSYDKNILTTATTGDSINSLKTTKIYYRDVVDFGFLKEEIENEYFNSGEDGFEEYSMIDMILRDNMIDKESQDSINNDLDKIERIEFYDESGKIGEKIYDNMNRTIILNRENYYKFDKYDESGRLIERHTKDSSGDYVSTYTYDMDDAGRIVNMHVYTKDNISGDTYDYDVLSITYENINLY